jgi:hypothetical protein
LRQEDIHQPELSFAEASKHQRLSFFQRRDGLLAADSRILFQELIQRISGFEIVQESLKRDSRSAKNGLSAMDVGILDNHALRVGGHGESLPRCSIISSNHKTAQKKAQPAERLILLPVREFLARPFAKSQLPDALVSLDAIPRTSVGKFKKIALREQFADWKWE